jgi:hypothetical protein
VVFFGLIILFKSRARLLLVIPAISRMKFPLTQVCNSCFAGLTNAGYIPNVGANNWLRKRVLGYCNIPVLDASRPVKNVVALKRINSSRYYNLKLCLAGDASFNHPVLL